MNDIVKLFNDATQPSTGLFIFIGIMVLALLATVTGVFVNTAKGNAQSATLLVALSFLTVLVTFIVTGIVYSQERYLTSKHNQNRNNTAVQTWVHEQLDVNISATQAAALIEESPVLLATNKNEPVILVASRITETELKIGVITEIPASIINTTTPEQ